MNRGYVADASVAVAWLVESQATTETDRLLADTEAGVPINVPVLWTLEVANALLILKRRGRIDEQGYNVARNELKRLRASVDGDSPQLALSTILDLAEEHKLSVYDAVYLELALRRRLPIASRDTDLNKAAKRAGVQTLLAR